MRVGETLMPCFWRFRVAFSTVEIRACRESEIVGGAVETPLLFDIAVFLLNNFDMNGEHIFPQLCCVSNEYIQNSRVAMEGVTS